jgi:ABC-2 type transport system ATP-binding protein
MTADHLIVVGRGRLLADVPTTELTAAGSLEDAYLALTETETETEYPSLSRSAAS